MLNPVVLDATALQILYWIDHGQRNKFRVSEMVSYNPEGLEVARTGSAAKLQRFSSLTFFATIHGSD
jgi:hypothetical protein